MAFSAQATTQTVDKVNASDVSGDYVPKQVVVELSNPNETPEDAHAHIFSQVTSGFRPVALHVSESSRRYKKQGARYILNIDDGSDPKTIASKLSKRPGVLSAGPNYKYYAAQTANDTNFALKDDLYNTGSNAGRTGEVKDADIDAELAWKTTGGTGSVIAVIDTGVQLDHPDLDANIWTNTGEVAGNGIDDDGNGYIDDVNGWDFIDDDNDPNPSLSGAETSHGTHVAGIAAAELNNAAGIAGVAPAAKIMPLRSLNGSGGTGSTATVLDAIDYAVNNGANVVNMSFGTCPGEYDTTFDSHILSAYNSNVVLVAAAGNANSNCSNTGAVDISVLTNRTSPVSNDCGSVGIVPNTCTSGGANYVLGVAATTNADARASYSYYSSQANYVDVGAPGGAGGSNAQAIYSTYVNGGVSTYDYLNGTSMASPQAAGVAALVHAMNGSLTAANIISAIRTNSDSIGVSNIGAGRLNAAHAVNSSIMTRFDGGGGGGVTRYDVAVQTSKLTFPQDATATTATIASGTSFADGLAGSGMARFKNGPLLLTDKSGLASGTLTEIQRVLGNTSKQIYILGGTSAISSNIETQLNGIGYTNHTRVVGGGVDRVDTAIGIANISNPGTVSEAILVNKDNFPDGVSASAVTAKRNIPLLVNAASGLDARNSTWLDAHNVSRVYLVGGTTVLSSTIQTQIQALGIAVTRLANTDRYGTSAEVAKCFFSTTTSSVCNGVTTGRATPKQVGYAVGTNFPDALSGGPYMGLYSGPMLLVQSTAVPSYIATYNALVKGTDRDGFIFGGTSAINNSVGSTLASQLK